MHLIKTYSSKILFLVCTLITLIGLTSCSTTRSLSENQYLFEKAQIIYQDPHHLEDQKLIDYSLEEIAEPKPNREVLGQKVRLMIYNSVKGKRKLGRWIKRKVGEPPVLYNAALIGRSTKVLANYLKDQGYLFATVQSDTIIKGRKVIVDYTIKVNPRYSYRNISFPKGTNDLNRLLLNNRDRSNIKVDAPYQVLALEGERIRLSNLARDNGYFDMNPEYFYFFADTTVGTYQVDLYYKISPPTDSAKHRRYRIGDAVVYPNYILNLDDAFNFEDTIRHDGLSILQSQQVIRPAVLRQHILSREGNLFNASKQERSVNRLLDLGVFKYVNLKYQIRETDSLTYLDRQYYLTPSLDQDVNMQIEASTESNNFLGTALSFAYNNRNLFAGAEQLNITLGAGVETQAGNDLTFINTLDLNGEVRLTWPRFYVPLIRVNDEGTFSVPRTVLSLSNNFQRRTDFFSINSFKLQFGYDWRPHRYLRHEFYPVNINYINLLRQSTTFEDLLAANSRLRNSLENVFVLGGKYQLSYNDQEVNTSKDYWFITGSAEASGNLAYVADQLIGGSEVNAAFGVPFSQFLKVDLDVRRNFLSAKSWFVTRLYMGVGVPYGNADFLPYIRQFFTGGSNSIRSFRIRSLGPGSFNSPVLANNPNGFFDQTGDLKLEFNVEYRFSLMTYLKGAIFLDGGNIWLLNDPTESQPEGLFKLNRFYEEIALGTGLGLRLDVKFIVLRLDTAFPIRTPYEVNGKRWNLSSIKFRSRTWRQDNLVWHLAIGYPF